MVSTVTESALSAALASFGLEDSDDNREQLGVMVEALDIYEKRDAVRGGLWREAGAKDSAHHLKSKGMRVFSIGHSTNPEAGLDDAIDAINYAAFYVRNVWDGRIVSTYKDDLEE